MFQRATTSRHCAQTAHKDGKEARIFQAQPPILAGFAKRCCACGWRKQRWKTEASENPGVQWFVDWAQPSLAWKWSYSDRTVNSYVCNLNDFGTGSCDLQWSSLVLCEIAAWETSVMLWYAYCTVWICVILVFNFRMAWAAQSLDRDTISVMFMEHHTEESSKSLAGEGTWKVAGRS